MTLRDDELESLLRASRRDRFAPGFTARVMRRSSPTALRSPGAMLQRYFIWLLPAAVTAIALLAIHNAGTTSARGLDGLLAMQPVTLDAAYSTDAGTSVP